MATNERNFRSSYYEKVGCYSVEEMKSLKMLLHDDIRDLSKLKKFCLSYSMVPTAQRNLVWCLIMGILPLHKNATDYVREQRRQIYDDLLHAVTIMRYVEPNMPKDTVLHIMWLLEQNRLLHTGAGAGGKEDDQHFIEIVRVLMQIFGDDVETYWIAKHFYAYTREIQKDCPKLKELTQTLLKLADIALCQHLEKLTIFDRQCRLLDEWYTSCFASVISENALMKIWDKICGGSRKIVVFLFLELVKHVRQAILNCTTQAQLKTLIETVKDQDAVIVNKAIKTWQSKNHGEIEFSH